MLNFDLEIFKPTRKLTKKLKNSGNINNQKGAISIISIGVFLLLMVFILIMYLIIEGVMADIRNNNSQEKAEQMADSMLATLSDFIDEHEFVGYNADFTCEFNVGGVAIEGDHDEICSELALTVGDEEVTVTGEIKGRLELDENIPNAQVCGGGFGAFDCYIIPFPGQGNAGLNCDEYDPYAAQDGFLPFEEANNIAGFDNIDHPCNWNILNSINPTATFDLYHNPNEDIDNFENVNPIRDDFNFNLYIRLRTPCLPEFENNICENNANSRYTLADNPPEFDYILDWEFQGECDQNQPGLCRFYYDAEEDVFNEHQVDVASLLNAVNFQNKVLTLQNITGSNTAQNNDIVRAFQGDPNLGNFVDPQLKIGIVDSAIGISEFAETPHLEYQIITSQPISNPNTKVELEINFKGILLQKSVSVVKP